MWVNQIFSLISNEAVQNVIVCDNYETANSIARDAYGVNAIAVDTTQYPLSIGDRYTNGKFYREEVEILRNLTDTEQVAILTVENTNLKTKTENLSEKIEEISPTIDFDICTLEELKTWQINLNKVNLEKYLNNTSIKSSCHGETEKEYSISKDKQALLTQMILISTIALQSGITYQPSWNAKGESCTYDWTIEELKMLAFEIEPVVRPIISHQQATETNIKACATKDEVLTISIDIEL